MDVQVNQDEVFVSLVAAVVRFPPLQVEDLNVSRNEMLQIIRSAEEHVKTFKVDLEDCWCHVLPSLKKARVVSLSLSIPDVSPFQSFSMLKRYWKNTYGYRLPETDEDMLFCQVAFYYNCTGKLFTYPSVCLRTEPMQTVSRINPKPILAAFLQDLQAKHNKACGRLLRFEPKGRHPGIALYPAKQTMPSPNLTNKSSQRDQRPLRASQSLARLYQKASGPSSLQRQICQAKWSQLDISLRNDNIKVAQTSSHALPNTVQSIENITQESQGVSFAYACNRVNDFIAKPKMCTVTDNVASANSFALDQIQKPTNVPQEENHKKTHRTLKLDKAKDNKMEQMHPSPPAQVPCIYPPVPKLSEEEQLILPSKQSDNIPKYVPIFRPKPKATSRPKVLSLSNQIDNSPRHWPHFKTTKSKSQSVSLSKKRQEIASHSESSHLNNKHIQKTNSQLSNVYSLNQTHGNCSEGSNISNAVHMISATNEHFPAAIQASPVQLFKVATPNLAGMVIDDYQTFESPKRQPHEQTSRSEIPLIYATSRAESNKPGIFEAEKTHAMPVFKNPLKSDRGANQCPMSKEAITMQQKAMSPFLVYDAVKTCPPFADYSNSKYALYKAAKLMKTKRPATEQNDNGNRKKTRSKPSLQAVDIETLAKIDQLAKVNTITLLTWLKERSVQCTTKDKKSDLIDKVKTYLHLTI